jgi:hypothetical protein
MRLKKKSSVGQTQISTGNKSLCLTDCVFGSPDSPMVFW